MSGPEYGYVAYIDEAGDDGLRAVKPITATGASEWLILSAVVIKANNQDRVPVWVREIQAEVRNHQSKGLHFTNLNPKNKALVCSKVAGLDVRCFVVASNKKNMQGYQNVNRLGMLTPYRRPIFTPL